MPSPIQAVIFDYGNVLCEPQPLEDIQAMAVIVELPEAKFSDIYWRDRVAYDRDEMSPAEYWNRLAGRQLAPETARTLIELDTRSWTHPRGETLRWIGSARESGLGTALLSNLPAPLRDALENDCPWLPPFDVRTYSCTIRSTKPDREIYDACLQSLGIEPSRTVFLDDRPENVEGARVVGMEGVVFRSARQAAHELAERFGVVLNGADSSLRTEPAVSGREKGF